MFDLYCHFTNCLLSINVRYYLLFHLGVESREHTLRIETKCIDLLAPPAQLPASLARYIFKILCSQYFVLCICVFQFVPAVGGRQTLLLYFYWVGTLLFLLRHSEANVTVDDTYIHANFLLYTANEHWFITG